jgi:hypothetical protein
VHALIQSVGSLLTIASVSRHQLQRSALVLSRLFECRLSGATSRTEEANESNVANVDKTRSRSRESTMGTGCDPRDVDETEASDFARFVGKVSAAAATEAWRTMRTPPAQIKERDELPPLHVQAEQALQRATAEGRRTPPPRNHVPEEEKTTCLHAGKAHESSARPQSSPSTEEAPSSGESERLERLTRMAEEDLDILEARRMQRISPRSKGQK